MNRLILSVLFAATCIPVLGMAQTPATPAAQTAKLAWMNLEQALLTTDEGKSWYAEIQKYVEDKQKEMDSLRTAVDNLRKQREVQGPKLTDEALAKLDEEIDTKDTAIQRFQQDTQKDIENKKARLTNTIGKKMQPVIEKLAKERGITAILILNGQRDAYVDASAIITDDIVKAYNQSNTAGGAKAPAAPATPAPKKP